MSVWKTINGILHRRCSKCREYLPADKHFFRIEKKMSDRLHAQCRDCEAERKRIQYAKERKFFHAADVEDSLVRMLREDGLYTEERHRRFLYHLRGVEDD